MVSNHGPCPKKGRQRFLRWAPKVITLKCKRKTWQWLGLVFFLEYLDKYQKELTENVDSDKYGRVKYVHYMKILGWVRILDFFFVIFIIKYIVGRYSYGIYFKNFFFLSENNQKTFSRDRINGVLCAISPQQNRKVILILIT